MKRQNIDESGLLGFSRSWVQTESVWTRVYRSWFKRAGNVSTLWLSLSLSLERVPLERYGTFESEFPEKRTGVTICETCRSSIHCVFFLGPQVLARSTLPLAAVKKPVARPRSLKSKGKPSQKGEQLSVRRIARNAVVTILGDCAGFEDTTPLADLGLDSLQGVE